MVLLDWSCGKDGQHAVGWVGGWVGEEVGEGRGAKSGVKTTTSANTYQNRSTSGLQHTSCHMFRTSKDLPTFPNPLTLPAGAPPLLPPPAPSNAPGPPVGARSRLLGRTEGDRGGGCCCWEGPTQLESGRAVSGPAASEGAEGPTPVVGRTFPDLGVPAAAAAGGGRGGAEETSRIRSASAKA
jgi:hypothetical protein